MFSLKSYNKLFPNFSKFNKLYCIKANTVENVFEFRSSFSEQQSSKILETLNESSPEELSKYKISLSRIQKLTNWKSKKGPFKTLNEILEVEGFGENILKEIGESITCQKSFKKVQNRTNQLNKLIKHLVVPEISSDILSSFNSAVAVHLDPTGIGWARLEKGNNTLTGWICENFSSLPQKMMLIDTFNLAIQILRKTPPGDIYIFETLNSLSLQAQSKQAIMATYNQKIELISMLLALINTSVTHNAGLQRLGTQEPLRKIENRVFFLKSNIPARLFGTLIGSEKVSAVTAINAIVKDASDAKGSLFYTPIKFEDTLKRAFFNQSPTNKELMAQALMLGVSFMDLYVHRTPNSYEALNFNKNKKTKSS